MRYWFCLILLNINTLFALEDGTTLSIYFENDLFANTDREYTNGTKISIVSPDIDWNQEIKNGRAEMLSPLSLWFVKKLQPVADTKDWLMNQSGIGWDAKYKDSSFNIEFIFAQQMYTPENTASSEYLPNERPYGGWLYTGVGIHRKTWDELDIFEFHFGLVGSASLAQETQDLVHSLRKIPKAQGWKHQLENELGLGFVIERKNRVFDHEFANTKIGLDMISHYGASLGNVLTQANAGIEIRAGWNIPKDFGETLLGRSGNTSAPNNEGKLRWDEGFSFYFFTGVDGRAVARNIFLDGNTFRDGPSVEKENWVGDWVGGTSVRIGKRLKMSYSQVVRTREYKNQNDNQIFGSAYISWIF